MMFETNERKEKERESVCVVMFGPILGLCEILSSNNIYLSKNTGSVGMVETCDILECA